MKFKLLSDLHLEFYRHPVEVPLFEPTPTYEDKDTVLLLAGDVHLGRKAKPWIEKMCERFYDVVYILGNHEFYNNEWFDVKDYWANVEMPDNFTFLDDDIVYLDDVRIIGGTLWTEVTDPFMVWQGPNRMADYQVIGIKKFVTPGFTKVEGNPNRKLTVNDTTGAHIQTRKYIEKQLQDVPWNSKTIVMTHHMPHPLCVAERFKGQALNCFFMTDLDHIIENFDIDYWVCGHTHNSFDVEVHGTKILCNPMGYHAVELNQDFNEGLVFELP